MPRQGSGRRPSATAHRENRTLIDFELLREFLEFRATRTRIHRERTERDLRDYRSERAILDRIEALLIDSGIAEQSAVAALLRETTRQEVPA